MRNNPPNLGTIVRQSSLSYLGLLVQVPKNLGVLQFLAFVLSVAVSGWLSHIVDNPNFPIEENHMDVDLVHSRLIEVVDLAFLT